MILLDRGVVLDTKAEVKGFGFGLPTLNHLILIKSRTGFEPSKACAVDSELNVGAGEKWGLRLISHP